METISDPILVSIKKRHDRGELISADHCFCVVFDDVIADLFARLDPIVKDEIA